MRQRFLKRDSACVTIPILRGKSVDKSANRLRLGYKAWV
jgi:hypothetical protein